MQIIDGQLVYSATDLVGFLACTHLPNLERAAAAKLTTRPMRADPELDRIVQRGFQHEARFLAEIEADGRRVTKIDPDASIPDPGERLITAAAGTLDAMRRGDDVIYQATFFDGVRRGHPDFLVRVDTPSDLGDWSYEVWDTKLARQAKGSAVLQVCLYSDMLTKLQGTKPEKMYLALAGSKRETVELRFDDYSAYYRLVRRDFESLLAGGEPAYPPPTRPDPVEHCDVCRWSEVCRKQLRQEDDLSLVAGITSNQRRHLRERGIKTRSDLAATDLPISPALRGSTAQGIERVVRQARIQVQGEQAGETISELLEPPRLPDQGLEPDKGLLSLPPPSPGDLFFDIEGDPFALEDGVDYLFGIIEPGLPDANGQPTFHSFWAVEGGEVTPAGERRAFEAFIDLVADRRVKDPNLHIYHFAPYEPTAVKRLMGRYGTREDEVDELLRGGVFVDLFRAVRQGIRASVESYSIKKLEPLYGYEREVDLRDAGSSIVEFETWLELGDDAAVAGPEILQRIEEYNRDDCLSTWKLRDWLEQQRDRLGTQLRLDLPRPVPQAAEPSPELRESMARTQALVDALVADVPDDPADRSPEQQGRWLLAQLLNFHRREEKSMWWRYYHLMRELTDEERVQEPDALGMLSFVGKIGEEKQSIIYRFSFPPQDHKIVVSTSNPPHDPATGRAAGTVVAIDDDRGTIDIKRGKNYDPPAPVSLVPLERVGNEPLQQSLQRLAAWVIDNGIDAPGPYRAARDLLLGKHPNAGQTPGDALIFDGERTEAAAHRLVASLNATYLPIQGPPGSGKTRLGAELIVDLIEAGKRVGVTAGSHKVIGNLLAEIDRAAERRKVTLRIGQRPGNDGSPTYDGATSYKDASAARDAISAGEVDVVGGTAWLWSREDMQGAVDVLFVDEAGQMSLANAIAVASAADSVVLLGDPQQLDQPLQGVHPPGAGRSILAHVLGAHHTMPPAYGLFIEGTWRLHPDICAYTSEAFYDNLLRSNEGRELQGVFGVPDLPAAGIVYLQVEHEGNSSESEEEAAKIKELLDELLAAQPVWRNADGDEKTLALDDVLIVTPYNAQVNAIGEAFPGVRVGTVDKFQGQEAPISIYSLATSSPEEAPRGMDFLYSHNRLNVATSRASCIAIVVASPALLLVRCRTPKQMHLANALARLIEMATGFKETA